MANYRKNSSPLTSLRPLSHSPRFDELAVALPEHIDTPILKKLALNVQAHMFVAEQATDLQVTAQSYDCNAPTQDCEIGSAKAILDYLLDTVNADASVLVAITNEACPKVLLTRRAGHLNAHAGEVSFAGGKYDEGDHNNVVTALREACEETALPPSKVQIVGQLPTQISKSGMSVRPIVALVEPNITYVPELGEIDRIFWADLDTLIKQPTTEYQVDYQKNGQTVELLTPCWTIDNETVWGLTGRILASLLEISFNVEIEWYYRFLNSSNDTYLNQ